MSPLISMVCSLASVESIFQSPQVTLVGFLNAEMRCLDMNTCVLLSYIYAQYAEVTIMVGSQLMMVPLHPALQ